MNTFMHSTEAINVLHKFYNKNFTMYVEGSDDAVFWGNLVDYVFPKNRINIEIAGGCKRLEIYCQKIINEGARFIIGIDYDHKRFAKSSYRHDYIIYTYGYSIENTIYCVCNINRVIKNLYHGNYSFVKYLLEWKERFCEPAGKLLIFDILNHIESKSIKIFGDNCGRFLVNERSSFLDSRKIEDFIQSIKPYWDIDKIEKVKKKVLSSKIHTWNLIKGHFITTALANLIKYDVAHMLGIPHLKSLPIDNLYALTIDGCQLCKKKEKCKEFQYFIKNINKAINQFASSEV